ncbi:MAG: hypothetical protein HY903_08115 [Deltaproteobacteria bacterium]|nr:hypothetical protein [Deltaproteobacteria bacterium]
MLATAAIIGLVVWFLGVGLVLGLGAFSEPDMVEAKPEAMVAKSEFFAAENRIPDPWHNVPIDLILSQLEHHIRLEDAAAESFMHEPSKQSLRARTLSSLSFN